MEESILQATQALTMEIMGCSFVSVKQDEWIKKLGQQQASLDTEWKSLTSQQSGSNSWVYKQLLLIFKGSIYWWKNKKVNKILLWLYSKPYIQTEKMPVCRNLGNPRKN